MSAFWVFNIVEVSLKMSKAKIIIKQILLNALYYLNINEFYVNKKRADEVLILAYHESIGSNFDKHISYLISNNYKIISMDDFAQFLNSKGHIPRKSTMITFDDGWRSNFTEIYPVVCKHNIPIIIYLISEIFISDYFKPWSFVLAELKSGGVLGLPDEGYFLSLDDEQRERLINKLRMQYADQMHQSHALSLPEIIEMQQSGLVVFGSHTATHANLNSLPKDRLESEIVKSKQDLEFILNQNVDHLAYPRGDFSVEHFDIVKKAGYKTAVTIVPGWNNLSNGVNPYALRRIFVSASDDVATLSAKISGLWHGFQKNL